MNDISILTEEIFCVKFENNTLATWVTGKALERWLPGYVPEDLHLHHMNRYDLACRFVERKKVLDIACGTGYGSYLLAINGNSESVLGVDIDVDSIRYGNYRFPYKSVKRIYGDALYFKHENSFEVIVSFETIEHLRDVNTFLKNMHFSLKEDGVFLVSTPIVQQTRTKCDNPHHVVEWSFHDFHAVISKYFSIEEIYVQNIVLRDRVTNNVIIRVIRKINRILSKLRQSKKSHRPGIEKWVGQYQVDKLYDGYQVLICKKQTH